MSQMPPTIAPNQNNTQAVVAKTGPLVIILIILVALIIAIVVAVYIRMNMEMMDGVEAPAPTVAIPEHTEKPILPTVEESEAAINKMDENLDTRPTNFETADEALDQMAADPNATRATAEEIDAGLDEMAKSYPSE